MKSSRIFGTIGLLILAVILFLGGCHSEGKETGEGEGTSQVSFLDEEQVAWKDNTLDDMHAVFNFPVKFYKAKGEQAGGSTGKVISEMGCVLMRTHLFGYGKDWSGVNGFTAEGEEFNYSVNVEPEQTENHVHAIGPVSGARTFVACRNTLEKNGRFYVFFLYWLDEDFQATKSVKVELDVHDSFIVPDDVAGDKWGNVRLTYRSTDEKRKYAVVSPEGETVFEETKERNLSLCAYGDGRVALCEGMPSKNNERWRFYEADVEGGKLRELAVSKDEKLGRKMSGFVTAASPVDDYRLLWCTPEGLFLYDTREEGTRNLYKWSNHGITMPVVERLAAMSDGRIGILYGDSDGRNYVLLKTSEGRDEIQSITFAVSSDHKQEFLMAAASFNKRFPAYNVNVIDGLDETSLLTQLGAGEGPVLVDTSLTGFEDLERLWQPLDEFMERAGLEGELIPEALCFGKIGGVQYGIVRGFHVQTLITAASGPPDWDYEGFLGALEEAKGAAPFAYDYFETAGDRRGEFFAVLENGLDDACYVDADAGKTIFGTAEFDRVVRLSERARECQPAEEGKALREGRALCEKCDIFGFRGLTTLRMRLEESGENLPGYPTRAGARHLLVADEPIAMRKTATEEEKQIAYTFLKLMLSEEGASSYVSGFSVRRDALEGEFQEYKTLAETFGREYNMPVPDREKDVPFLEELIGKSTPKKAFPSSLQRVFDEEIGEYLDGRIDAAALSDHLQNRFWLYLEEQK